MADFYFRERTPIETLYYDYFVRNGRDARIMPLDPPEGMEYLVNYELTKEIRGHLHPFEHVKPGDRVITVGVHDGLIELGLSQLFTLAALVGKKGFVWAVEPDQRNIQAIEAFIDANGIENVKVIPVGAWSEKTVLEFVVFDDFSSSNTVRTVFETKAEQAQVTDKWGSERVKKHATVMKFQVDTLDHIVETHIREKIDWVNLTVNGAESEVLKGMDQLLQNPRLKISYPLRPEAPMNEQLRSLGFDISVADCHSKPWDNRQFLVACAMRNQRRKLKQAGFCEATITGSEFGSFKVQVHQVPKRA